MRRFADGCFLILCAAVFSLAQDGGSFSSKLTSQAASFQHHMLERKSVSTVLTDSFGGVRADYASHIRTNYSFPFGEDLPFAPSNIQIEGNNFIQAGAFPTAEYCGHCHAATYKGWQQSLHRNSFRAPFYRKVVDQLIATKGIEYSRHCEGCHSPISLLSGALSQNSAVERSSDEDGITCSVCHSVQSLQPTYGVGSYVMGVPAVMVDERGKPIPGTVSFGAILAHPERHSRAVMKDFYKTPQFCGACHKANIPRSLSGYKWMRAISLYDEWQASSYSKRSPLPFYSKDYAACQACHMARETGVSDDYGAKDGTLASHRWLAGNTAVPFYYGFDQQLRGTIEFLKKDRLNVDIFGLTKGDAGEIVAPLGSTRFELKTNDVMQVTVVIQNKGLGHTLIPEQRDIYEAWVEFIVRDSDGREIYHSGYLKPDGSLDDGAHSFTSRLVDKDGRLLVRHEVWARRSIAYDATIAPGRSCLVRYEFRLPRDAKGPLSITASVNYRHFNQTFLNFVLGQSHTAYPVVEMASRTRVFRLGYNEPTPAEPQDNPDWMRWNNFGIALLDQGRCPNAATAFGQVVRQRPDYVDGFVNIALADLLCEKYSEAEVSVKRALQLESTSRRALYYRALVERSEGLLDSAVADLEVVTKDFPQSLDAHRELAVSYYLNHKNDLSQREFETVQKIDPDNLTAHYYLSLLYCFSGRKKEADQQAALYEDQRDDPASITPSQAFLVSHPELSRESVPWHVHKSVDGTGNAGKEGFQRPGDDLSQSSKPEFQVSQK